MSDNRARVLVVEDDAGIQHLIRALLKRLDVVVDVAPNGRVALEMIAQRDYNLLLVDLMMPILNGVALLGELAQKAPWLLNHTVIMTALSESQIERNFGSGLPASLPMLRKPFDISEFLQLVKRHVQLQATNEELFAVHRRFKDHSGTIGAKAGVLVVPRQDGVNFDLVTSTGYSAAFAESFFPMVIDKPFPICEAFRTGKAVWIASLASAFTQYPDLAPVWMRENSHALVALPVEAEEVVIGAAGWTFADPQRFDDEQRGEILRFAASYAPNLSRLTPSYSNSRRRA